MIIIRAVDFVENQKFRTTKPKTSRNLSIFNR